MSILGRKQGRAKAQVYIDVEVRAFTRRCSTIIKMLIDQVGRACLGRGDSGKTG